MPNRRKVAAILQRWVVAGGQECNRLFALGHTRVASQPDKLLYFDSDLNVNIRKDVTLFLMRRKVYATD